MAGCGPSTPDYKSIWTTTTSTTTTAANAEKPISLSTYFENIGITGAPVAPDKLTDLTVTVPEPPGWKPYFNVNLSPGTRTIAKGDTYPTAMILVFQLDGNFDVAEALKHANGDAELSENFKQLNASTDDFRGFPSSMIEGTYDLNGQRMQSYNRIVFARGTPARANLPGQMYLVQLTVTSFADKAQADGPDIESIIKGFVVAPK
ncbi:LpqN/LpqT family lipoprotein [Mycobacterium sp. NPDC006124]|uniref:LpqN/LpqT family lipoprotein n=1 Tax=Mycobacterium sp. NPDC006124 TaxID=3156729 RepID=UPI0033B73C24